MRLYSINFNRTDQKSLQINYTYLNSKSDVLKSTSEFGRLGIQIVDNL